MQKMANTIGVVNGKSGEPPAHTLTAVKTEPHSRSVLKPLRFSQ